MSILDNSHEFSMGHSESKEVMSMTNPTSFVYEDLISHIQAIQYQMIEGIKYLDHRWDNDKKIRDQLKSHSLTIVDPYGNPISQQYMDHELISTILKKFKKNYVPKHFHQWIRFGQAIGNEITPIKEPKLSSTVGQYGTEYPIVTYGEMTVWIGDWENILPEARVLKVCLTDTMEKIQMQLKNRTNHTIMELRACTIEGSIKPDQKSWKEGKALKSTDTIMSAQLHQTNCIIMAKMTVETSVFVHVHTFFVLYYRLIRKIAS